MAKKLSLDLRPASFRGVPFQVDSTDLSAGRRTQVHEYPKRDKPYVEDLGRAARDLNFTGFVVGDNYVTQANSLLDALEKEGPGTLIHPWLGTISVCLKDVARVAFDSGLGVARISMSFVEAGELDYPAAGTSTQAVSRIAAANLQTASIESFASAFSVKGFQDFVTSAATGHLGNVLGVVSSSEVGKVLGISNNLARAVSSVVSFVSSPSALGSRIMSMFGLSGVATSVAAWSSIVRSLSRVSGSSNLSRQSGTTGTPSRRQASTNTNAINSLTRQAMIAQAVGASSLVGTAADVPAAGAVPGASAADPSPGKISYQGMLGARDELLSAIDAEAEQADDAVYAALMAARNAVWADLTARARDSARLVEYTPPEVMPALVIVYDRHEDASRDIELVARNNIRHPGFVPVEPLKMLTR